MIGIATYFSLFSLKTQRKFSIYCLAGTINMAQFIFQILLRLLLLISVFRIGCSIKTTYLKKPRSKQNKLHDWWTNPFCFFISP